MPEEIIACRVCKEAIKKGATKCIHCESYQGLSRYFSFSAVVLSLLIALISVTSATIPQLVLLLTPQARPNVSFLRISNYEIHVAATNRGKHPAVFKNAVLQIISAGAETKNIYLDMREMNIYLPPDKWVEIRLYSDDGALNLLKVNDNSTCILVSVIIDVDHKTHKLRDEISCKDVSS